MKFSAVSAALARLLSVAAALAARRKAAHNDLPSLAAVATRGPLDMRLRAVMRIRRCIEAARQADGTLEPTALRVLMVLAHHLPRQPQSVQLRVLALYGRRTCGALARGDRHDLARLLLTAMQTVHSASTEREILGVLQRLRDPEPVESTDSRVFFRTRQLHGRP